MTPTSHAMRVSIRSPLVIAFLLAMWVLLRWASYPWPNYWLPAHLSLVPLSLLAVRAESTKQLLRWTYAAGVAFWAIGCIWLFNVASYGYLVLGIYMGVYPMLYVLLLRTVSRGLHLPLFFAVPMVWVSVEYVRGFMFSGMPWFGLGHSQPTQLIQIADLFGSYGVSFVVAMSAGVLCDLLTQPLIAPGGGPGKTVRLALVSWLLVMIGTIGYGQWRLGQAPGDNAPTLRVAVIQTDVPLDSKWEREKEQTRHTEARRQAELAEFDDVDELTRSAAAEQPDLIVWPETTMPRPINRTLIEQSAIPLRQALEAGRAPDDQRDAYIYWAAALDYQQRVHRLAIDTGAALIIGGHAFPDPVNASTKRHNSAYLISPEGQTLDRYDKVHRVPFGEYVLFEETFPWLAVFLRKIAPLPGYSLQPGENVRPLAWPSDDADELLVIGTPICFEDIVSYVCREMIYKSGRKRGHLLVNLTNDGWFPGTAEAPQHEQIARFRCIENRVPMARSVNRGVSGFIDSSGRIISRVEVDGRTQEVAGYAVADLRLDSRSTLFGRIGNLFAVVCVGLTLVSCGLARLHHRITRKATR